ncbi:MAG: DoxX family protein [Ardenticatenaceae bacterium]|nr:DoxX family protein [Ardenticatenaceae bacterium]
MDIVLWILQALLAVMFLMAGLMKATRSKEQIKESGGERMAWVDSLSEGQVTTIGVLEVLAGIGLILPQLTGILPILTPLAAVGLVLTMIGAALLHIQRGDGAQSIMTNIIILLLAAFVAYGRFALVPV